MFIVTATLQIGIVTETVKVRTNDAERTARRLKRRGYAIRRIRALA